jgi:hypothetical protein
MRKLTLDVNALQVESLASRVVAVSAMLTLLLALTVRPSSAQQAPAPAGVNSSREAVMQKGASEGMARNDTPGAACTGTGTERGTEPLPPPTIAEVRAAMSTLNQAMQKINEGNGKLGRLLTDPTLYEETQCAVDTLRRVLTDIQQNPGRYIGELQVF